MKQMRHLIVLLLGVVGAAVAEEQKWENNEATTMIWRFISQKDTYGLQSFLAASGGEAVNLRSEDGRGGLWWAWEYKNSDALAVLAAYGVDLYDDAEDAEGNKG